MCRKETGRCLMCLALGLQIAASAVLMGGCNTWPAIAGTVSLLFILQIPGIIGGNFDISYLLGNPANAERSDILQTLIYRKGMQELDYGYSTAAGLVTSIASLILLVAGNKIVKAITKRGMF